MKRNSILYGIVSIALIAIMTVPVIAQGGPRTPNFEIHVYLNPDVENEALDVGTLDLIDWPLEKLWIEHWLGDPSITMRSYSELGMFQFDINNQRWPTGDGSHDFFDEECVRCLSAREFRKALAYLTDKGKIIAEIVKGFGLRLELVCPMEAYQYVDVGELEALGLIIEYDEAMAISTLANAGFQDWDDDDTLEWKYTGTGSQAGATYDSMGATIGDIEELPTLDFYIRMDDPLRKEAGERMGDDMKAIGIPVNIIVNERTVCYKQVMVLFDYHLYTGGWIYLTVPDTPYDFFHSSMYYGAWCPNYPGYMCHEYDDAVYAAKYPTTVQEAKDSCQAAAKIYLRDMPAIPLWSAAATKAYKTGWSGMVNNRAYGVDNFYSYQLMEWTGAGEDDTIDLGFKSDIEQLNIVASEWYWDAVALANVYDTLMARNPFTQAFDQMFVADSYELGTWDNGGEDCTEINFTLRPGVVFNDGTPVTLEDIEFSIEFLVACGPGVAWAYSTIQNVVDVTIVDSKVRVRLDVFSLYGLEWIGGQAVIKKDLWSRIEDGEGRTWTHPEWDSSVVREYDPISDDLDENGVEDLKQDGTACWRFESYVLGSYVAYVANTEYYLTADEMAARIATMFHAFGDVNEDSAIGIVDVGLVLRALGTTPATGGSPGAWGAWNPAADIDANDLVGLPDLLTAARNFGGVLG
jgi:ABC-type transport system substrate-binding protein